MPTNTLLPSSSSSSSEAAASERKRPQIDQSSNWSLLPPELLSTIFSLLPFNTDCISFRSVCPSWRSASPRRLLFPYLLYSPPSRLDAYGRHLCLYLDLAANRQGTVDIPQLRSKQICGATDGWLVLRGNGSRPPFPISVLNPFTQIEIPLPSLEKSPLPPEKIVLTSFDPDPSAAVAIMGSDQPLYFFSRLRSLWRPLQSSSSFHDAICFNGALYAIDATKKIFVYDPITPETVPVEIPVLSNLWRGRGENREEKNYLVELESAETKLGDLYLVIRGFRSTLKHELPIWITTDEIQVFKLDLSKKPERRASGVSTLHDGVFFVGVNTSFSISGATTWRLMLLGAHPCNDEVHFTDDGFNRLGEMVDREDDCGKRHMGSDRVFLRGRPRELCYPVIPPAVFFIPSA